jgi:hypothetical protein
MRPKSKAYPYPVLSYLSDDYNDGSKFEADIDLNLDLVGSKNVVDLVFDVRLTNTELNELLLDRRAKLVLDVSSPQTLFRDSYPLAAFSGKISFSSGELYGSLEITAYVVAMQDFPQFSNVGFNKEFQGGVFQVQNGDVLAISETSVFDIVFDRDSDPDLMRVILSDGLEPNDYEFDLHAAVISVRVGENVMNYWSRVRADKEAKPHLYQGIYKDCLMFAIEGLSSEPSLQEFYWAKSLKEKIEAIDGLIHADMTSTEANSLALKLVASEGLLKVIKNG